MPPPGRLSFHYWQAWIYLFIFVAPAALKTVYLWKKDPKLLEHRVNSGPGAEKEKSQRFIQLIASVAFIGGFVLPSLDHRLSWSEVPLPIMIAGGVLVALGFFMIFIVFKENPFSAATIEVAADQKFISTGPYAVVRHPMHSGVLIMLFGTILSLKRVSFFRNSPANLRSCLDPTPPEAFRSSLFLRSLKYVPGVFLIIYLGYCQSAY